MCNFLDQLLHPYKFYGRDMSRILFFIFASCEPLKGQLFVSAEKACNHLLLQHCNCYCNCLRQPNDDNDANALEQNEIRELLCRFFLTVKLTWLIYSICSLYAISILLPSFPPSNHYAMTIISCRLTDQ